MPDTAEAPGVDEILDLLAAGAHVRLLPGVELTQLDHALQTAARLRAAHPGDDELAVAGLVHDIGHLVRGSTDETHAEDGARTVVGVLGPRVARAVAMHVEAKRYLVAVEAPYGDLLRADSAASLVHQGGPMPEGEAASFLARPGAADAVALRRADDAAKLEDLDAGGLEDWAPVLRRLTAQRTARHPG